MKRLEPQTVRSCESPIANREWKKLRIGAAAFFSIRDSRFAIRVGELP